MTQPLGRGHSGVPQGPRGSLSQHTHNRLVAELDPMAHGREVE